MRTSAPSNQRAGRVAVLAAGLMIATATARGDQATEAELFADGVVSTADSYTLTMTPDQRTAYFCRALPANGQRRGTIMESTQDAVGWGAPRIVPFSGEFTDMDPMLSPDGSRLFFASLRPPATDRPTLWVADRIAGGWSRPRQLTAITGPDSVAVFPCPTANGNLYFAGHGPKWRSQGDDDIYVCRPRADGSYGEPENLGPAVNSPAQDYDAYVAPDESFLVFASRRSGGINGSDFYASVRIHGEWQPARNLGPLVNLPGTAGICGPYVSPDREWIYFTSNHGSRPGIRRVRFAALGIVPMRPDVGAAHRR